MIDDYDDYEDRIFLGHCLDVLKKLPDESFHAVVTDPPYGLGPKEPTVKQLVAFLKGANLDTGGDFMGADWEIPSVPIWREVFRVLKPGGHVLSFGGTRAWDLISLGLRAAGFEYRDTIADECAALQWIHGQGMPKSLNVSKAIDKEAGAEREVIGTYRVSGNALTPTKDKGGTFVTGAPNSPSGDLEITAPATPEAKEWDDYGTALKPAWEPILVFRKPLVGRVIDNVREHGTGAINIGATRVNYASEVDQKANQSRPSRGKGDGNHGADFPHHSPDWGAWKGGKGRWPSNLVLAHAPGCKRVGSKKVKGSHAVAADGKTVADKTYSTPMNVYSPLPDRPVTSHVGEDGLEMVENWQCIEGCPVRELDEQSGDRPSTLTGRADPGKAQPHPGKEMNPNSTFLGERSYHSDVYADSGGASRFFSQFDGASFKYAAKPGKKETQLGGLIENNHPTKKPVELMKWLIRLVCFKGAKVLDPYCGSGSTLHAACEEGVLYTGIERDKDAFATAQARMDIVSGRAQDLQNEHDAFDLAMSLGDDDS